MPTIDPRRPVSLADLSGQLLPQDGAKTAETASYKILLASKQNDTWGPDFQCIRKTVVDPVQLSNFFELSSSDLRRINSSAAFERVLKQNFEHYREYLIPKKSALLSLFPEGSRSEFVYTNVVGQRIEKFFDEAIEICQRCDFTESEGKSARRSINELSRQAFRNRLIEYDNEGTNTYWSFKDPFMHVYQKILRVLPDQSPYKKVFQAEVDHIFLSKYTPQGEVNEADIERSLGLIMIDRNSRDMVNMRASCGGQPEYVTVKGKIIDAEDITFRRPMGSEMPRPNMVFDWNHDRMIGIDKTGWFGHCDIKAVIDCLLASMSQSGGLLEFSSDTRKTTFLSKDMLLEVLASVLEFSDNYISIDKTQRMSLGISRVGGSRHDALPENMLLQTSQGYKITLPIKLNSLSKSGLGDIKENLDLIFSTFIPDDPDLEKMKTFAPNGNIVRTENGDQNYIKATSRRIDANFEGVGFNASGERVNVANKFSFSLREPGRGLVLLGSMESTGPGKNLVRYYYNKETQELLESIVNFSNRGGRYIEQELPACSLGKIVDIEIGKEVQNNDDVMHKLEMLKKAMSSGIKIAADHDVGAQVWNGEIHGIREDLLWKSSDGRWEKIRLHIEGTFGKQPIGIIIHELNKDGSILRSYEALAAVDFYWERLPRVAPLIYGEDSRCYVNEGMLNRGVIQLEDIKSGVAGCRYLYDLIHIGLNGKNRQATYSIAHQGERLLYDEQRTWLKDISLLSGGVLDAPTKAMVDDALASARADNSVLA